MQSANLAIPGSVPGRTSHSAGLTLLALSAALLWFCTLAIGAGTVTVSRAYPNTKSVKEVVTFTFAATDTSVRPER